MKKPRAADDNDTLRLLESRRATMVDFYILLIVLANVLFYVVSLVCVWLMRRRVQSLETGDAALALREALIDE